MHKEATQSHRFVLVALSPLHKQCLQTVRERSSADNIVICYGRSKINGTATAGQGHTVYFFDKHNNVLLFYEGRLLHIAKYGSVQLPNKKDACFYLVVCLEFHSVCPSSKPVFKV